MAEIHSKPETTEPYWKFPRPAQFNLLADHFWPAADLVDWSLLMKPETDEIVEQLEAAAEMASDTEVGHRIAATYLEAARIVRAQGQRTCATCHAVLAEGPQPAATYEASIPPQESASPAEPLIQKWRRAALAIEAHALELETREEEGMSRAQADTLNDCADDLFKALFHSQEAKDDHR